MSAERPVSAPRLAGLADGCALRFVLPRRALAGQLGERLGARAGESLEFHDYRDYAPGDDLRNLDWNVLARTDREVVRVHREEIAPVVEIFADRSPSMDCPPATRDAAEHLIGLVTAAADTCRVVERDERARATPRAIRLFISDLLFDDDPERRLAALGRDAAQVHVVRILAQEERIPAAGGEVELIDSETGERRALALDATTRAAYRAALDKHTAAWRTACRRYGATFTDLTAESPVAARIAALAASGLVEG